ncbi:MAG TPA: T9SS type A sorting domain-containing protein, partial [Bacteroidota bacterium]|nr:T9SS type A sorting domain-containing protein [Bacteroidota bacterium]
PAPPEGEITVVSRPEPQGYSLEQNYPNPFNPATTISYGLPAGGVVSIEVFNVAGEQIGGIDVGYREAGYHAVSWDARHLPSGVYFYRVRAGAFSQMKKMVLLK